MTDKLREVAQQALDAPHGRKEENNGRPDQIRSGVHGRLPLGIRSDHVLGNRAFSSMMTDALWGSNEVMAINAELGLTMEQLARLANAILNAAPTPPVQQETQKKHKPLFAEMIAQHPGLAEELAQQDAQAVPQGFDWSKFPGHLIDNYEGEVLTEELLQQAAADLCVAPTPPAQQGAQAVPLVTEQMIAAGQHAWMTADGVDPVRVFNAMLNAAHTPPAQQDAQEKQS